MRWPMARGGGLGAVAVLYVAVDYLCEVYPTWHQSLQPVLWSLLALVAVSRVPFYRHWSSEARAALPFVGSVVYCCLRCSSRLFPYAPLLPSLALTGTADIGDYINDKYHPQWGRMSFLVDFLRPTPSDGPSWYSLLKKAGGGCNDLLYSGHMLVAVLTAMAWTEAYGGFSSTFLWLLVAHSAQREVRERHHYTVDCIVAIYVGILLWKMTGFIWSADSRSGLAKLGKIHGRLVQAAKDSDIEEVRELLKDVELGSKERHSDRPSKALWVFACATVFSSLTIVLLAFTLTSDG